MLFPKQAETMAVSHCETELPKPKIFYNTTSLEAYWFSASAVAFTWSSLMEEKTKKQQTPPIKKKSVKQKQQIKQKKTVIKIHANVNYTPNSSLLIEALLLWQ